MITEEEINTLINEKGNHPGIIESYKSTIDSQYDAIISDYDGTLTDNNEWQPNPYLMEKIYNISQKKTFIIVSGRGKSLYDIFKPIINNNIVLASYNGALTQAGQSKKLMDIKLPKELIYTFKKEFGPIVRTNDYVIRGDSHKNEAEDIANSFNTPLRTTKDGWIICPLDKANIVSIIEGILNIGRSLKIGDEAHKGSNDELFLSLSYSFSVGTLNTIPNTCFHVIDSKGTKYKNSNGVNYLIERLKI